MALTDAEEAELKKKLEAAEKLAAKEAKKAKDATDALATKDSEIATVRVESTIQATLAAAGVADADDRQDILDRWRRIPEADREEFGVWFPKAAKEDKGVRRIMAEIQGNTADKSEGQGGKGTQEETKVETKGTQKATEKPDPPPSGRGTVQPEIATPKNYTPEKVQGMSLEEKRKNAPAIRREWGYGDDSR